MTLAVDYMYMASKIVGAMLHVALFGRTSRKQKYGKIKMKVYYAKVPRSAPDCWNYF
jgi:hypothetical protein